MGEPDWENFAKAVLTDWPTGDLDGSVLFDLSLQYGMIQEVAGGYNSDHHIDAEGIAPEEGDPWYEYTFRGEAGRGLYSVTDMNKRIEELQASKNEALNQLDSALYSVSVLEKRVNSLMAENAGLKAKLPDGRKPLPDEWFAERAQMQERIEVLEAQLAEVKEALRVLISNVETSEEVANEVWIEVHHKDVDRAYSTLANLEDDK